MMAEEGENKVQDRFSVFATIVANDFHILTKEAGVFDVDADGDALYGQYLGAFPEGANPIFRKNTEHDCSCCKRFIRRVGGVVAVKDGKLRTIWDRASEEAPAPYNVVATRLRGVVQAASVRDLRITRGVRTHNG